MSCKRYSADLVFGQAPCTSRQRLDSDDRTNRTQVIPTNKCLKRNMVNVGGRSRGCSTCRRRRVKCDETRPICRRCERCGFECSGAKETAFIDQGKILRSRKASSSITILRHDTQGGRSVDRKLAAPASLGLKGFEIQTYICYTRKYLLRGGPVDLALQGLELSDIRTAAESTGDAQMLHRAILSLATIFFGSQHGNLSITNYGYNLHGVALGQLSYALSDPECYTRDEVFLSVATLALLECFVPTGRKYYLKHMSGLERLLELRGPTTHCYPESVHIHEGIRRMIILASLSTRKPSILAREEWKSVPWSNGPKGKLDEHYLFNALADCTVIVAEHDKVMANWELDIEDVAYQRDKVSRTAINLLEQLHLWRTRWDSEGQSSNFEVPPTYTAVQQKQETCERNLVPLPAVFTFTDNQAATTLMLYNTTLIFVLQILASLPRGPPGILSNQYYTETSSKDSEISESLRRGTKDECIAAESSAALEICRCIPYHLSTKSFLDAGSLAIAHLAIRTAWMTLCGSGSSEERWITYLLNTRDNEVFAKGLWVD